MPIGRTTVLGSCSCSSSTAAKVYSGSILRCELSRKDLSQSSKNVITKHIRCKNDPRESQVTTVGSVIATLFKVLFFLFRAFSSLICCLLEQIGWFHKVFECWRLYRLPQHHLQVRRTIWFSGDAHQRRMAMEGPSPNPANVTDVRLLKSKLLHRLEFGPARADPPN